VAATLLRPPKRGRGYALICQVGNELARVSFAVLSGTLVDTLDSMLRAGPRHLERQWQAAQIFRSAYEVLKGAVGNVMDFDRIRGAGLPGSPPPPRQLFAADRINEARGMLYAGDYMIIP
jgi:hypothetical protein